MVGDVIYGLIVATETLISYSFGVGSKGFILFSGFQGQVIDKIQASVSENSTKNFIYLGDGSGDYCPTLKLGESDYVMPRKNYPLWKRICCEPLLVKAKVHEWSTGEELKRILLYLMDTIAIQDNIGRHQSV